MPRGCHQLRSAIGMWCYAAGVQAWPDVVTSKLSKGQKGFEGSVDGHLVLSRDYLALGEWLNLIVYCNSTSGYDVFCSSS